MSIKSQSLDVDNKEKKDTPFHFGSYARIGASANMVDTINKSICTSFFVFSPQTAFNYRRTYSGPCSDNPLSA